MDLYIDNASQLLDSIHLLEAATAKAALSVAAAAADGEVAVAMLSAEHDRLRRELQHHRRMYAAQVAEHLRSG
jgi:hypothetical protein